MNWRCFCFHSFSAVAANFKDIFKLNLDTGCTGMRDIQIELVQTGDEATHDNVANDPKNTLNDAYRTQKGSGKTYYS
jgi:hypothetical protein